MHSTNPAVLIVDDERPVAELVRAVLSPPCSCVVALSLTEALSHLNARTFDLVLVDRVLTDGSGLALLSFLRTSDQQTVAIVLSEKADEESLAEAHRMGASEFIRKPINLTCLLEVVESAFAYKASHTV